MKKQLKTAPAFDVILDARNPETHRIHVTIKTKKGFAFPTHLHFPVWTPGSYMIREYSRHITRFVGGKKIDKNSWEIPADTEKVSYEVYCFERSVRTSYLDANYAALVGATLLPLLGKSFSVRILLPRNWSFVESALNFRKTGGEWRAIARDDDHWIDCPIVAATPGYGARGSFRAKGIAHRIAWVGSDCARPMKDFVRDFRKIAETVVSMLGGTPMKDYWFLLHFGAKMYGGLEHRNSQLSQFDGGQLGEEKEYKSFLRLIAHEYFHSWNVKSIRPKALGPFDYTRENYTEDLWFAEGLTDYFDDIIPLKAGLFTQKDFLEERFDDVKTMSDGNPGHTRRALSESSFDAWIRYYRPDEDSINSDVSYYAKGSLLGWCWDAHLQKKSKGKWSLEKLMRAIWKKFGVDAYVPLLRARPGFTRAELLAFAEQVTGIEQKKQVENWVAGRRALPWREAAKFFGIDWSEKVTDPAFHQFGMQLQWKGSQAIVQKVIAGSSAEEAKISAGDEIIALNSFRLTEAPRLASYLKRTSGKMRCTLSRAEQLFIVDLRPRKHANLGVEYTGKMETK